MSLRTRLAQTAAALLLASAALVLPENHAGALSANFEGYAVGTVASALSIPGVSFNGQPGHQWVIYPGGADVNGVFSTPSGHILIDPVADGTPSTLEIVFDSPQSSVSFIVVAGPKGGAYPVISANAYNADVATYSGSLGLSVPSGGNYYEGTVSIPGPMTRLRLHSDAGFGIDSLTSVGGSPVIRIPTDIVINPRIQTPMPILETPILIPELNLPIPQPRG